MIQYRQTLVDRRLMTAGARRFFPMRDGIKARTRTVLALALATSTFCAAATIQGPPHRLPPVSVVGPGSGQNALLDSSESRPAVHDARRSVLPPVGLDPSAGQVDSGHRQADSPVKVALAWPGNRGREVGSSNRSWQWQVFPDGLIWRSYLAGVKEPRCGAQWFHERKQGWLYEAALGARVGIVRYGTQRAIQPEGWQFDFEGGVFPRIETGSLDVVSSDFRYGAWLTRGLGAHRTKFAFYHLSAHLADEYMVNHPEAQPINYIRDVLVLGHSYYWTRDLRLYGEAGCAVRVDAGSEPWEFQFGIDYSPAQVTGFWPDWFAAINGHLRQEVDFGGNLSLQTGLQWRGNTGNLFRLGMYYYSGKSNQYQFFNRFEDQLGMGLWYDF
jgi:hypothetical protein